MHSGFVWIGGGNGSFSAIAHADYLWNMDKADTLFVATEQLASAKIRQAAYDYVNR